MLIHLSLIFRRKAEFTCNTILDDKDSESFMLRYRVFLQVHRFSEGLRVFTLKEEIQQLLTAHPPRLRVVRRGTGSQLAPHGLTTLHEKNTSCQR